MPDGSPDSHQGRVFVTDHGPDRSSGLDTGSRDSRHGPPAAIVATEKEDRRFAKRTARAQERRAWSRFDWNSGKAVRSEARGWAKGNREAGTHMRIAG